jgi:integrase
VSASITTRATAAGEKRYLVRYRLGGRAWPVRNAGTFATMKEAKTRRDLIAGEIAAGRDPAVLLATLGAAPAAVKAFRVWADEYRQSRVELADETRRGIKVRLVRINEQIGDIDPARITPQTIAELVASLKVKPSSLRRYIDTVRAVLNYAGVDPNPARDARVRLPREERTVVEPPSSADVAAILEHARPVRWRLPLQVLAETGMRVGELCDLEWRDVDISGSRFRVRDGKTRAARRWVAVPPQLMEDVAAATPVDDRTPERRVFGDSPDAAKNVVRRACISAGIALHSPHDLRHRYISVQVARGVPITNVAAQVGHSRKSLTLDTYSHVLLDEMP